MDKYKIIVIIVAILVLLLIIVLSSRSRIVTTYEKYMKVGNLADITGQQLAVLAKRLLGLDDLKFALTDELLGDAYSPKYKTLVLSEKVCYTASLSSMAIVSHELGHAMQDRDGSLLLTLTRFFRLITNFTNRFIIPLLIFGIFFYFFGADYTSAGLIMMSISISLFGLHIITLFLNIPLEYNASARALKFLQQYKVVSPKELEKAKHLLHIAALTYVAGLLDGILLMNFNKQKSKRKKK